MIRVMSRPVPRWFLVLAALALMLAAQPQPASAADAQFPLGSRVGLVPPPSMTMSHTFLGFEDDKNNVFIRIVPMPAEVFASIEKQNNDFFKKQGMAVEKREPVTLANGKGLLLVVRQEAGDIHFRKWMLIAPLANLTALVSFEIRDEARSVYPEAAIRAALTSVVTRTVPPEEQLQLVPFRVADLAGLRVAAVVPGTALQLTDGPKDTFDATEQPHLVISIAPGGPEDPRDRDAFARLQFDGLPPLKDIRMAGGESMRVNGQPGYETRAEGIDPKTGAQVNLVQWLRFGNGAYLRILAFAPKDIWVQSFARFRAVRDSLEPR